MTSTPIPFLLWLVAAAVAVAAVTWLTGLGDNQYRRDPWPGTICARCRCGADYHQHHRRGSDCGLCGVGRCWEYIPTADTRTARSVEPPYRHGVTDETPLYDQAAVDRELRELLDGAA